MLRAISLHSLMYLSGTGMLRAMSLHSLMYLSGTDLNRFATQQLLRRFLHQAELHSPVHGLNDESRGFIFLVSRLVTISSEELAVADSHKNPVREQGPLLLAFDGPFTVTVPIIFPCLTGREREQGDTGCRHGTKLSAVTLTVYVPIVFP